MAERATGNAEGGRASSGATAATRDHETVTAGKKTTTKERPARPQAAAAGETPVQAPPRAAGSTETTTAKGATMAKAADSKTASRPGQGPAEEKVPGAPRRPRRSARR